MTDVNGTPGTDLDATPIQTPEQLEQTRQLSERPAGQFPRVPGYDLIELLGEGAYGEVWLARDERTNKRVAIKLYSNRRGIDWTQLNREVEKLALLDASRNIVHLLDVGWQHDPPYFVMEYLAGGSLEEYIREHGTLTADDAVRIVRAVCEALVYAHGRGILHCDLKPANVLLDAALEPKLCDFGQSRLLEESNASLGTLFYMPPEQADLQAVPNARWDVYSLGALLYFMLVGKPPLRTGELLDQLGAVDSLEKRLGIYREIVTSQPSPRAHHRVQGVDRRGLADIIDRCLRTNPEHRYSNAQQVLDALNLHQRRRRNRPLVALGGIGPGVILFAMFFFAANAMNSAVQTAEENLTSRALESDVLSVGILARSIDRELQDRLDELVDVAADDRLREAIEACDSSNWSERNALLAFLDQTRSRVDERRDRHNRELDVSWFFVDASGTQRWRSPFDAGTIDEDYSWRDYFHGLNQQFEKGRTPDSVAPLREPHISLAFVSEATQRTMVALSVPVWNVDRSEVIGVLARTTHLGQLLSQYEFSIAGPESVARTIALIDSRNGRVLDHSRFADDEVLEKAIADKSSALLKIDDETTALLNESESGNIRLASYRDPLSVIDPDGSGGEWLAAFAPIGETGWTAVVQERVASVLRPVYRLQARLVRYAWFAFGVSGVVVASMWYFVLKRVNEGRLRIRLRKRNGKSTVSRSQGDTPR
ncbi:MAG: serine/threonine protein kinase [Planctomycetota bacterium]|jgi:serine/threonine protein kinase